MNIVIPAIPDDKKTLKLAIESLRQNLEHPIDKIYLVVPDANAFAEFDDCEKLNEAELMGFPCSYLRPMLGDRAGWLYQQLIKLNADKVVTDGEFLAYDADHVLLKPHKFKEEDGTPIFYTATEFHPPYFEAIKKLFDGKVKKSIDRSFISDCMLFNAEYLSAMKTMIEDVCGGNNWMSAILAAYQPSPSGFSEFETYGNFVTTYNKYTTKEDNRFMCFKKFENNTLEEIKALYPDYASVTQHKYAV